MDAIERNAWSGASWRPAESSRRACLAAIVVLHAAAVLAWWQLQTGTVQRVMPTRVTATLIAAPVTPKPPDAPPRVAPKPLPAKPRAAPAPPVAASAPVFVPMPEVPAMAAPRAIAVESTPIVAAAPAPAPAPAPVPAPAPIVAPRFDAAYLENAAPAYPTLARQYREQGVVMLKVRVMPSGRADTVEIHKSSGSVRLDDAARAAVSHWRFVPARQGDLPVTAWVVVPVRFSLNG